MKRIINIALLALLGVGMFSCDKMDADYVHSMKSSVYFVNQSPIGTLSLGDDNDNDLTLSVPVVLGGLGKNTSDRKIEYVVDESLTQNLFTSNGEALVAMPQSYYTFATPGSIVVPKGSLQAYIDVQLNDAFLNDPNAVKNRYVIALKLTSSDTDSILQGKAKVENPDPRIAADWAFAPKDYVLFLVKYINKYQGNYLHFGKSWIKDQAGNEIDEAIYSKSNNATSMLSTFGKNSVSISAPILSSLGSVGIIDMNLTIDNEGSVSVNESEGSPIDVAGSGTFVKDGGEWDGLKRNMIVLDYSYSFEYNVQPTTTILNNKDAAVSYTGGWTHNGEAGNYNDDRSYAKDGSYFEFEFVGFEVAIYTKTGGNFGMYDVYIDDELVASGIDTYSPTPKFQVKTFEKTDLSNGLHQIRCVTTSSKNVLFDYYEYSTGGFFPNGTYDSNVKDTLLLIDRSVEFETFKPVIE
jgi:hypothetical protein